MDTMVSGIFPLTILPGIGLLIMSTTNWSVALVAEINALMKDDRCSKMIMRLKIAQLSLLNRALVMLYISASMCALGGFIGAFIHHEFTYWITIMVGVGMAFLFTGTTMLIFYSLRAVSIKRKQFIDRL